MPSFKKATAAYSIAHFVVDFSCAYMIYSSVRGGEQWTLCLLVYNFFAFAVQMPLGVLADHTGLSYRYAVLGCALVAASPLLGGVPLALCALAGLGNALFHIGGGRDVLMHSRGRFSLLGVFVSPGALGLYLGVLAGRQSLVPTYFPPVLLLLSAGVILLFASRSEKPCAVENGVNGARTALAAVLPLLCLFLVVIARSYVGMTLSFPWSGEGGWSVWLLFALALGKAAGGFLADWLGATEAAIMSLLAATLFFALYSQPVCGVLAVFFFNMSMPVTLGAAARLLPKAQGFGFGLLTFGLFLGFLPVLSGEGTLLSLPWGFCAASVLSAVLLSLGMGTDGLRKEQRLSLGAINSDR